MSAVLNHPATTQTDVNLRLAFQKQLQLVTNKIHATSNIDEIMLEVSSDICQLFNADPLTIYSVGEDKQSIVSKVKTGLNSFKDLKLPIADQSIAGHVALSRKIVNIRDVYDEGELKAIHPQLRFLQEVDKRTALEEFEVPALTSGLARRAAYRSAALEGSRVYGLGGRGACAVQDMEAIIEEVMSL